jgi:hypothetical protein
MALLAEGDYRAKAIDAQLSFTSKGTEQVAVRFALIDFPNQTITWWGYFSEAAFDIAMKGLRAAGFKGNDLADLSSLSEERSPEVVLVVAHETYKDKVSARVKFINSAGGMALKDALQPDQAKAFAERMKGKVLAFDQSAGAPPASPPKPGARPAQRTGSVPSDTTPLELLEAQAGQQSDDIPF